MSSTQVTLGQSARKRKHEDDRASPAESSKRSKSERRRDKQVAENGQPQDPVPQKSKKDTVAPRDSRRDDRRADPLANQPVGQPTQIGLADSKHGLTKERKKQRKKAKKLAREVETLHRTTLEANHRDAGGAHEERLMAVAQRPRDGETERKAEKRQRRRLKGNSKDHQPEQSRKSKAGTISTPSWTLSPPSAGRFLDHDPIFVQDEDGQDFLIAATEREIQVLSLETSLVVRTLPAPCVLCYAVENHSHNNIVWIAQDDSTIYSWDWTNDRPAKSQKKVSRKVKALSVAPNAKGDGSNVYWISNKGKEYAISNRERELHTTKHPLQSIQVLGDAEFVVAQGPSVLILGMKKASDETTIDFIWTEISLTTTCTSFDARLLPAQPSNERGSTRPGLSLAIGNQDGQIHLYEDVSPILRQQRQRILQSPRILHWHREAVSSVKFSRDGNYLISGGKETVLVLWQLETGKKQFLPHLTSEIERIVVNSEGDRYALQMGDKSIMVLNTSELKPVANFAGLQMHTRTNATDTITASSLAATLHPKHPHQLLLSVPSTQPKSTKDVSTRPFLQTFDTQTSRHITRQALTRNNVTDFNLGPERTPIISPDVNQIAISHGGEWLATVDEWMPPASDLAYLGSDDSNLEVQRQSRREVYLKFWSWDKEQALWSLTTRVDSAHSRSTANSMASGRVLALASDPATTCFSTIGEDSCVNIWRLRTRTRHGVPLKGQTEANLVEWTCKRTVQLVSDKERADSPLEDLDSSRPMKACLAYSADGSMLAAAQSTLDAAESPLVHFINTTTGELISKPGLAAHEITKLGFLERYFISVSRSAVYVWDLVNDTLVYKLKLSSARDFGSQDEPMLAINDGGGTFALVIQNQETGGAKVEVYGAREPRCLYRQHFDTQVGTILAGKSVRGYTLVFADATIRTLSPSDGAYPRLLQSHAQQLALPGSHTEQLENAAEPSDAVADVEMADMPGSIAGGQDQQRTFAEDEDDRPVVRPEQLARVFDTAQSFAMPPVKDMFEAVVDLFGRKPNVRPPVDVDGSS